MSLIDRFKILLKKWLDTPSFLVGDKVIIHPAKNKGIVTIMAYGPSGWTYYVEFTKELDGRRGWWESDNSLTKPYIEDLMNWDR